MKFGIVCTVPNGPLTFIIDRINIIFQSQDYILAFYYGGKVEGKKL